MFSQKKSISTTLKSLQWKHFIYLVKKYRLHSRSNQASEWEIIQNERIQFTVNLSLVLRPLLENISMGRMDKLHPIRGRLHLVSWTRCLWWKIDFDDFKKREPDWIGFDWRCPGFMRNWMVGCFLCCPEMTAEGQHRQMSLKVFKWLAEGKWFVIGWGD